MAKGQRAKNAPERPSDAALRMNFLYQASAMFTTASSTRRASRFFSSTFRYAPRQTFNLQAL
jgi:hypothetical protein